jgi:hypothetical protein
MENDKIYSLTHKRVRTGAGKLYSLELLQNSNAGTEEYHKISRTVSGAKYAITVLLQIKDMGSNRSESQVACADKA